MTEVARDPHTAGSGPAPQGARRSESPTYKGIFPIERFPSPPSDGYLHYEDDEDEANETREQAIGSDVFYPPLLEIVYPPKPPLDIKDPTWLATMLYDVQRQRKYLTHQLDEARTEATAALVEATLAQSELDEETKKMQEFLNLIAKVAGNDYVKRLLASVEYVLTHKHDEDADEDGGDGNGGEQGLDGASDRGHDNANSDAGSRSRGNSVSSSSGYDGRMPTSHDLHAYISQSPQKLERQPSLNTIDEQERYSPATEIHSSPSATPEIGSVGTRDLKRPRDDLEDMYAGPGPSTASYPRASKRLHQAANTSLVISSASRKRPLEDDDDEPHDALESASHVSKGKGKAVDNGRQSKRPRLGDGESHEESSSSVFTQSASWFKWLAASVSAPQATSTPTHDADESSEEVASISEHSEPELQYPYSSEELTLEHGTAISKVQPPASSPSTDLSVALRPPQSALSLNVQPVRTQSLAISSDVVPYTGPSSDAIVRSSSEAQVRSLRPRPEGMAGNGKKVLMIDRARGPPLRRDPWRIREKDGEIELHHVDYE